MNTLYTKNNCLWCSRLKEMLANTGVTYTEVNVEEDIENLAELKKRFPEVKTVPQFFVGDRRVGGFDECVEYFSREPHL